MRAHAQIMGVNMRTCCDVLCGIADDLAIPDHLRPRFDRGCGNLMPARHGLSQGGGKLWYDCACAEILKRDDHIVALMQAYHGMGVGTIHGLKTFSSTPQHSAGQGGVVDRR